MKNTELKVGNTTAFGVGVVAVGDGVPVANAINQGDREAVAARMVACWNAMLGVDDPVAWVAEMRRSLAGWAICRREEHECGLCGAKAMSGGTIKHASDCLLREVAK